MSSEPKSENPLPFLSPETIAAIQADPFAMAALEGTRQFLQIAHRDWTRITRDGKMIFDHDEAGIAWAALGEMMGADYKESDLPSDTTVNIGGVCMNVEAIDTLQRALVSGTRTKERANA